MVNCDNCSAVNLDIRYSGGWGLDIVQGSDNFIAYNNSVRYSHNGAAVFFEFDSIGGTWSNNTFINNNTSNNQYFCEGINVKTNPNNITLINNTSTGQLTCPYIF